MASGLPIEVPPNFITFIANAFQTKSAADAMRAAVVGAQPLLWVEMLES
jgi:hypothetical protein